MLGSGRWGRACDGPGSAPTKSEPPSTCAGGIAVRRDHAMVESFSESAGCAVRACAETLEPWRALSCRVRSGEGADMMFCPRLLGITPGQAVRTRSTELPGVGSAPRRVAEMYLICAHFSGRPCFG